MNSTIRIMSGNDNYRSGSLQVNAQMLTSEEFPAGGDGRRAYYPNDLHKLGMFGVSRLSQQTRLPGSTSGHQDLGVWWDGSYSVPDGMVFMVQLQRRSRQGIGDDTGRILLRTRASGPLWRLSPHRIVDPLANPAVIPVIEGRWDFLTWAQAVALGCAVVSTDPAVRQSYAMARWNRMCDYAKLAEGTPAPRVSSETVEVEGEAHIVQTAERRRRINVD